MAAAVLLALAGRAHAQNNVALTDEQIVQALNRLGVTVNGVYTPGGGPWTRVGTTLSPSADGDTLSLSGQLTWKSGLGFFYNVQSAPDAGLNLIGSDNAVGAGNSVQLSSGNNQAQPFNGSGLILFGTDLVYGGEARLHSGYSPGNAWSSSLHLYSGHDDTGVKPFITVNSDIVPFDDGLGSGIAALGSSTSGFSKLWMSGPTTWTSGLGYIVHVPGPADNFLQIAGSGGAGDGVQIYGDKTGKSAGIEVDCVSDNANLYLFAGTATDGTGGVISISPSGGLNGKPDGYVVINGCFVPSAISGNGVAQLGSAALGFQKLYLDYTNTATVGDVTINKASGRVNMAALGTTFTVTNNIVTAKSHVTLTMVSDPGVALSFWATPSAGSFTVNVRPAVVGQTAFDFVVHGAD